ncbi:hypothetical protein M0802_014045 [Mischocyttarus mexicanus]|nr:hypothetical protein M0802_014046 [Mischocyttarus mexicanus]KAI4481215.1 hypothetical protein M0802_014045 [Mischocyttarus mexicanus]
MEMIITRTLKRYMDIYTINSLTQIQLLLWLDSKGRADSSGYKATPRMEICCFKKSWNQVPMGAVLDLKKYI